MVTMRIDGRNHTFAIRSKRVGGGTIHITRKDRA